MDDSTERQIAHLAMIQAIIARMAANSFALKTLSVTLVAGIIALVGAVRDPSPVYVLAGLLPVAVFWWLDAAYLQLERLYRALYDDVRKGAKVDAFDMNVTRYRDRTPTVLRLAVSWSVIAIYLTLVGVLAIVATIMR